MSGCKILKRSPTNVSNINFFLISDKRNQNDQIRQLNVKLLGYRDVCMKNVHYPVGRSIRTHITLSTFMKFKETIEAFMCGNVQKLIGILNNDDEKELFSFFFFQMCGLISINNQCTSCNQFGFLTIVGKRNNQKVCCCFQLKCKSCSKRSSILDGSIFQWKEGWMLFQIQDVLR